jgi:hypothetical protein
MLIAILAAIIAGLVGCASSDQPAQSEQQVSSIPWNRPERWESQGPFGGFMPGSTR